jgi:hypothetical protein
MYPSRREIVSKVRCMQTVPKPTQVVGLSILRRSSEISLRNSANYLCNLGIRRASDVESGVAKKWPKRLFTKNTGLCEVVRRCIGTDTCPVPEG